MSNISVLLLSLLFLWTDLTSSSQDTEDPYLKREHSLIKPYHSAGMEIPYWDFMGSTIVLSDSVQLTSDTRSKTGMLWNTQPVLVPNWDLHVHFRVRGTTKDLYGDGFAIWYAKDKMRSGPVFGSINPFSGLAIIADTYSNHNGPHNHEHPYVSAMINNGTLVYDHDRDGTHTMVGGCSLKFRNLEYDTFLSVKYSNDVLTVSHSIDNTGDWKQCFAVSGVRLPTGYYIGISASTGDLSDSHEVISMKLFELAASSKTLEEDRSVINPSSEHFEPPRDHVDDPKPSSMSGIKLFFLLLLGLLGLIACVVIGIMIYQKQQDNSRKRFY